MRRSVRSVLQVLLDNAVNALARGDALALCALERGLRSELLADTAFWESLTRQALPSLGLVPHAATPRGRRGFLWISRLLREDTFRVRAPKTPDAFRAPAGSLSREIVFLVDFFTQDRPGRHVVSCARRLDISKETLRWDASEFSEVEIEMGAEVLGSEQRRALQDVDEVTSRADDRISPVPARVVLSFYIPGDDRPPTVLLNEFASFYNEHRTHSLNQDGFELSFRTDVTECWHTRAKYPEPSYFDAARMRLGCAVQRGQDLRYGAESLPFDPCVWLHAAQWSYSMRMGITFEEGERQVLMPEALAALLRLREDERRLPLF